MALHEELRRWTEAGLLNVEQAERIAAFESSRPVPSVAPVTRGIGVTEVVAYAGTVVILVGLAFLFNIEHHQLGSGGRLLILGVVVTAALATGLLLEPRSLRPAARRARATAFALTTLAVLAFFSEVFVDSQLLSRAPRYAYSGSDESGNIMLAAAIASGAGAFLLARTWSGLVAAALVICVFGTAGAAIAFLRSDPGWGPEGFFLVAAGLLILGAQLGRRGTGAWGVEVLSFAAVVTAVIAALIFSINPAGRGLESFAAGLSILAFAASIVLGSGGYAVAGGFSLFIVTVEVGFRHFAQSLGFPVVLIASGVVLLLVAFALVRLLPRFARHRRGAGHLGGDGVDLGQQLGK